ncbi:MAG: CotH kinase family protein, partial [Anaerolineae bacterium]|nr:CotH kinase family protein [Anaerolineae bacterium]
MKRLERHSLTVLAVLVAALAAALWLAGALEHGTLTWPSAGVPALPSLSPPGGSYAQSVALEMAPASRGGTVVFATGGHVPTVTVGTVYERPVLLDAGAPAVTVVRAREVVGGVAGPVVDASYAVGLGHTLPILSIIADPLDLWDPARGLLANTWQRGQAWERAVHVTYIDGDQVVALPAGLRVDGSEPFDAPKQSLRLYFRAEYGAARLAFPIFPDHPDQDDPSYKRLLLLAGDRSGRWTLLEEQLLSEVAAEVGGRVTQGRFVLLFLNGESWGIYRLGERIDRFYLEDNLGLRSADLIRGGDFEEGDAADWERLMAWLATHDVSDAANFATLAAQVDVDDFTDYAILQAYFGFPANRFSAVRPQGGGRWSWLYGDWQRAWTPDGSPETMLADDDPEDVAFLLHKLLENSGYRDDFARRAAALLNTTLAPEAMAARVERLAAALRPDIGYEEGRWSAPTAWERNVAALEALTGQRHAAVQAQVAAALGLEGMAQVAFAAVPEVGGRVFVDGLPVEQGAYFLGVDV